MKGSSQHAVSSSWFLFFSYSLSLHHSFSDKKIFHVDEECGRCLDQTLYSYLKKLIKKNPWWAAWEVAVDISRTYSRLKHSVSFLSFSSLCLLNRGSALVHDNEGHLWGWRANCLCGGFWLKATSCQSDDCHRRDVPCAPAGLDSAASSASCHGFNFAHSYCQ